ncbi:MAG: metallophosphoesterase [Sandaracinus sp.]|nr:metallophosphoesterase [Sandaracinus sp.]MCB9621338.1 metallophosphoesterase [Sandaracinus sp.]
MRTLVVGDVHGCLRELEALLEKLELRPDSDRLVLVGDLVAKGPDSRGVVKLARTLGAVTLRGNHDEHVLRWRRAVEAGERPPELGRSHREVCEALDDDDWAYLAATPTWRRFDDARPDGLIVVHAALDPRRPLEAQREDDLLNGRSIRPDGSVSKRLEDGVPWASLWPGPELVVFGHDAVRKLQRHPHAIGLDTGCVYGGALTGVIVGDERLEIQSVPAARVYSEPKGAPR